MPTLEWPFLAAEALASDELTFRELRRFHRAVYPGVWTPRGVDLSTSDLARAAWLWSRRRAVVAGLTASALLGAKWVASDVPVELIHTNRRPPRGIIVRTDELRSTEKQTIGDLAVTTPARTAFDVGRHHDLAVGVQRIDALMNATGITVDDIVAAARHHAGVRGMRQLKETLAHTDAGSESPQESATRLLLVRAGIPRPETQIEIFDEYGFALIRLDMGWREWKVAVEYDGVQHWADARQRSWDIERIAILESLGWIVIRVSAGMLKRPQTIVERVRTALVSRGCAA